jgi:hypothetical protein
VVEKSFFVAFGNSWKVPSVFVDRRPTTPPLYDSSLSFDKSIISDTLLQMKAERPLKVVFFKTETGNEPVREWLKELPKEDCKVIGTDILTIQYAWPVGKPLVDNYE